ncbi:MAG: ATP-dependent protease La [Gammaproteobacteria bacterium]|jgi:ATP-dependent Lon protease|nr:ATP-dependent protease La [Gammaproteobacteria bacterium]
MNKTDKAILGVPVLPLRDVVVFPYMVVPLFVGRERSIRALEVAMAADKQILVVTQKSATEDQPTEEGIYLVGMLATVLQLLKLPDGTVKVLIEGVRRAKIVRFLSKEAYFLADVELLEDTNTASRNIEILIRSLKSQFEQYVKLNRKIPTEILASVLSIEDGARLADAIAAHLSLKLDEKQKILEMGDLSKRLEKMVAVMEAEIDLLQIEKKIRGRVKRQMEKTQREYYLNEQMKAIQKELETDGVQNEFEEIEKKIQKAGMTEEAYEKSMSELRKLKMMSPMSAEATVSRNYLDWILALPWKKRSKLRASLSEAEAILEAEHYGLKEVKERIIEYLAVQRRVKKLKGPILCLVGPPGVGKTSLGQSIAHATGRTFVRMSLGGIRDEAEIRGHRRTYIGAMPGKIVQKISKTDCNPFFLLDEIDKMATDFRGDPAAALLEVLDPEQNHAFNDHYLEVDYDLSDVMFVATANTLDIPAALRDRMEIIRIPGYTEDEKVNIALRHLLPKQMAVNGLKKSEIEMGADVIRYIVQYYTREAGVRNLEREISKILRKVVKEILLNHKKKQTGQKKILKIVDLENYLGVRRYRHDIAEEKDQVGQVKGLAWTEVGGELLNIEAVTVPGKGKVMNTGQLGEVMQESIQAALTVVRSRAPMLGIHKNFFDKHDIHIHVPEGATPKDGPSAGIGMCTALVSILTHIPVRADYAMTGEITLRGEVLEVGGIKEKLLAAHRGGIKHVIIPAQNVKDLKEIPDNIKKYLEIRPVRWIDEVLAYALNGYPERLPAKTKRLRLKREMVSNKKLRKGERARAH